MNTDQKLLATKGLVIISIILSFLSFLNTKKGTKEIYPFFYWKLYSQPLGNTYTFNDFRIYAIYYQRK